MSSGRLSPTFANLRANRRKALVTFVTAGDPSLEATVPALHQLVANGADVLEVGVPFSDPEAEGPAIQAASERALANGTSLAKVLALVGEFRATNTTTPVVLMGYLNSVLAMGEAEFARRAHEAGVDGVIMVNLPPEEAGSLGEALAGVNIDLILLVAPTTVPQRRALIANACRGFLYYVSLTGITGASHIDPASVKRNVKALKALTPLPVCVGFGIKDGVTAAAAGEFADGVVVGSALVNTLGNSDLTLPQQLKRLAEQLTDIRQGLDSSPNGG